MEVALPAENVHNQEYESSVSQEVSKKLDVFIQSICDEEKITEFEISKRCRTGDDNFLSVIYETDVKGKTEDAEKELHLFIKLMLNVETFAVSIMFENEIFAYTDMFEKFKDLQEQANVKLQERYKTIKMYKESNGEVLILENFAKKGFFVNSRMELPSLNFFQLAVKELAKFHALSFVLKETEPKYFDEKLKTMKYALIFKEGWTYAAMSSRKASVNAVDKIYKDKVEKAYDLLMDKFYKYHDDESIKACICHGDYRPCNIMMKLNENGVQEVIPIDYQLVHYGNPVFDLLYLIYSSTNREFRKAHLINLKELYYETLGKFLQYFQLDVDAVYPREDYDRVFEENLDVGLMIAVYLLPFLLSSGNQIPDTLNKEVNLSLGKSFKDRIQEVIEEFVDYGLI